MGKTFRKASDRRKFGKKVKQIRQVRKDKASRG